ncbi:ZIP family metal transporter [Mycoplasma zalophi]|uniref:ZIP family metal transporter n=1 Tax=Mycoplasma zalophi TaxID=191287 RepID=A0ABS6DQ48_9MOLU|nr:ZIP family metal transporter [Mycoplasma zalophi]MBU4691174.1 ZIP family metal transporter [Mycoplasma zalophi]MBU4692052.1 ZIP family metal transporter [Mycoplasma zalophi]
MFFKEIDFNNNLELTILINLLIYSFILLAAPVVVSLVLSAIKPKFSKHKMIYLYAFSTGMFLIIGSAGFIKEAVLSLETWLHTSGENGGLILTNGDVTKEQLYMAVIVGISALIGLTLVILWRYISIKKHKGHIHESHEEHGHSDHIISFTDIDNPKAAWIAILMLLIHRIIDGLVLGLSVYQMTSINYTNPNIGLIVTFNIHILVENIIIYYRQTQYGQTKWKAIRYNLYTMLLIIPILFFGAFLGKYLDYQKWVIPSLQIIGGVIIVFTAIFELVPEFIHNRNSSVKVLYTTFAYFATSVILTLVMLSFHTHLQPPTISGESIEIQGILPWS